MTSSETDANLTAKGPQAIQALPHGSAVMADALNKQAVFLPKAGDLVKGKILSISKDGAVVDIDGRHTGLVRGRELVDESGEHSQLAVGDIMEATVVEMENEQGLLELSLRQAGHRKAWDGLQKVMENAEPVEAKIIDANKGGLLVKIGNIEGFLPVSQLTSEHYPRVEGGDRGRILERLRAYIGQIFKVKVITVKESEEKLIVSERQAWEREQNALLSQYKVGDEVEGIITGVVDFGAFVEFGDNLEGLAHISELAWQRIDDPRAFLKVGENIRAKIISVEGGRVSLSIKQLTPDPWQKVGELYKIGQIVSGQVAKISPYGAFVELPANIHGLAHISELLANKEAAATGNGLKVGEYYEFKIISLEPAAHRLGLALVSKEEDASGASAEQSTAEPSAGEETKIDIGIQAEEKPTAQSTNQLIN